MWKNVLCVFGILIILSSCGEVVQKVLKITVKDATKETAEDAAEIGVRKTVKVMLKEGIKEIPKGRKALEVTKRTDGGYAPAFNNLGKRAAQYSDEFNKLLLAGRRKAISPYDQFPTMSQLGNYNKRLLNTADGPDAAVLRKNLYVAMDKGSVDISKAFGGNAAHHVIEGSDPAASQARDILKQFGIRINDPENGILLPENSMSSIYKGSTHMTHHASEYSQHVYDRIKNVKTREDLISKLQEIKHELQSGKLNLQGGNQQVSKNILM